MMVLRCWGQNNKFGHFFNLELKILNWSSTSQSCHQHKSSQISVTKIVVVRIQYLEHTDQRPSQIVGEYIENIKAEQDANASCLELPAENNARKPWLKFKKHVSFLWWSYYMAHIDDVKVETGLTSRECQVKINILDNSFIHTK